MQSQIREVMNQSAQSLAIPPGHGEPQMIHDPSSFGQPYQYGGHNTSMVNEKRPVSHLKNFSSRFSTTSYLGARGMTTEEQRIKREEHELQVEQMTWLDRQRQNKRFALYTFLGLNGVMLMIIIVTALVWVSLHLIKHTSTVGIPVNQNLQTVSN